jgi:hypothetical protein
MKRFVTRALIVVAAILGIVFAQVAPASASAPDDSPGKLASDLAALWTGVLQTPGPVNPAAGHGPSPSCWDLGDNTVAPFTFVTQTPSCTVNADTKLFVAGWTTECSTFDSDCDGDADFGNCDGTTPGQLLICARKRDSNKAPVVTFDGKNVPLTEVKTPPLNIVLPEDNIFDELGIPTPGGTGVSVAHGFVALLGPLDPGTHTIVFTGNFPTGTTTIVVESGQ